MAYQILQIVSEATDFRPSNARTKDEADYRFAFEFVPPDAVKVLRWLADLGNIYSLSIEAEAGDICFVTLVTRNADTVAAIRAEFGGAA